MELEHYPKILLLSSCTGEKDYLGSIPKPTSISDLQIAIRIGTFKGFEKPAKDMYKGNSHIKTIDALKNFATKKIDIDWKIISAGYGLLNPNDTIVPYEITFRKKENV